MLVAIDLNGTLGLCYSNKEIERHMRENLTKEQKEKIRDPKRNYLTLFGKPLAVLNITGWGRTPQRNVIVYCNLTLAAEMEKDSIKSLREQITREIQEEKSKMASADLTMPVKSPPVLTREEMVPYKHMRNLAELPLVRRTPLLQSVTSSITDNRNWLLSWAMAYFTKLARI